MNLHIGVFVIIQARPFQALIFEGETQRFDQMKLRASVGAQANDVARIGRYFWFYKNNVEHGDLLGVLRMTQL